MTDLDRKSHTATAAEFYNRMNGVSISRTTTISGKGIEPGASHAEWHETPSYSGPMESRKHTVQIAELNTHPVTTHRVTYAQAR